ncbi:MAG: flagellar protein FlaG, partial [FCB group bacterium]|nr:flagellar protein FlaG [FCB group bacterium]
MSAEAIGRANPQAHIAMTENRESARTHKSESAADNQAIAAPVPQPTEEEVRKSAEFVSEAVSRLNRGIRFEIDDSTHIIITKVIDKNTNERLRQIP